MKSRIEIMSDDEILLIHQSALRVLARTGFQMPNEECLNRCRKAGAQVDYATGVVRLPVSLTEELAAQMKRKADPPLDQTPQLSGDVSTQVFVVDYTTQTRRYGLTEDILKGIALIDRLDNIPSCHAVTIPADVDARITDLVSCKLLMQYAKKPGGTYILSTGTAKAIMAMSELLERKAFYLFESVSPLRFRKETLEIGLLFADRGHDLGIGPMIMGGMSAPLTLAGSLTLIAAEVLASIFAVYALSGSLACFFAHGSHTIDPRTLLCSFGSPNQALIAVGTAQMARFYGIPSGSNSALSDALMPDFQCGFEKTLSVIMGALAGSVSIGCQGIVGADQGFSFEQLLIDDEWLDACNYALSGFKVNEETIAEQLIHTIGIGGNFIAEEHTAAHLHDSWWSSELFRRDDYDNWQRAGARDMIHRAHARVEELTADYRSLQPVITGEQFEKLERQAAQAAQAILS